MTGSYRNVKCQSCLCWSVENEDLLHFVPSEKYPQDILPENTKLAPLHITWHGMMNAVNVAYQNYRRGNWGRENVASYLARYCIPPNKIQEFLLCFESLSDEETLPNFGYPADWKSSYSPSQFVISPALLLFRCVTKVIFGRSAVCFSLNFLTHPCFCQRPLLTFVISGYRKETWKRSS